MGLQVVRGLGWLHNKRILHGDLKIYNLFVITGTGEPVIKISEEEDEPTMKEEEVPIAESSELVEVKVEQLDDSSHYPSFVSSGASNSAASTSVATSTGIATSGATTSGATFSCASTSAPTSSSQVFSLPPFTNLFLSDITMNSFNLK